MDFWVETAKQIPSLGVLTFLVWKFLDYVKGRDKAQSRIQMETNSCIKDNTVALEKLSQSIHGGVRAP